MRGGRRYRMYGRTNMCRNGRGGPWANSVYQIVPGMTVKPKPRPVSPILPSPIQPLVEVVFKILNGLRLPLTRRPQHRPSYQSLGCWRDTWLRAIPTLEGRDSRLRGPYFLRSNAVRLCYEAARARGYGIFSVQNGGWCAGMKGGRSYRKYGRSNMCRSGRGGPWANSVYRIGVESRRRTLPVRSRRPASRVVEFIMKMFR